MKANAIRAGTLNGVLASNTARSRKYNQYGMCQPAQTRPVSRSLTNGGELERLQPGRDIALPGKLLEDVLDE